LPLETLTGRYELSNNNMLTLVVHEGSLFSDANGLPDEEFLFMGDDRFGSSQRNVSFRIARGSAGDVVGLTWSSNGQERAVPRIGPLLASIAGGKDPDPAFTLTVTEAVKAFSEGGAAVSNLKTLTAGARANLAGGPVRAVAGVRAVTFVASQDLTGRRIERHGGAVAKVLFYRLEGVEGNRWLLVYVTADNLITDYDVVEK
jgi:hypothetical protein